jgi:hypothetical protein
MQAHAPRDQLLPLLLLFSLWRGECCCFAACA